MPATVMPHSDAYRARQQGFDSGWKLCAAAAIGEAKTRGPSAMRDTTCRIAAMAVLWDHTDLATVPLTRDVLPDLLALYDAGPEPSLLTGDVAGIR